MRSIAKIIGVTTFAPLFLLVGCLPDPTAIKAFELGSHRDGFGAFECMRSEYDERAEVCTDPGGQQNLTIAKIPARVARIEFIDNQLVYVDFEFVGTSTQNEFETVKAAITRKYGAPDKESREDEAESNLATSSWDRMNGDHIWLHFEVSEHEPEGHLTLVINSKKYADLVFERISKELRERKPLSSDVLSDI